jgi:RHS repeat-associated protein
MKGLSRVIASSAVGVLFVSFGVALPAESAQATGSTIATGAVTTVAGSGSAVTSSGTGSSAGFDAPQGLAFGDGQVFVGTADAIMAVDPSSGAATVLSGIPGSPWIVPGSSGATSSHDDVSSLAYGAGYVFSIEALNGRDYLLETDVSTGALTVLQNIDYGASYDSVAYASDGNVYYTAGDSLYRMDPATLDVTTVVEFPAGNAGAAAVAGAVTSDDDNVYVQVRTYQYYGNYTTTDIVSVPLGGDSTTTVVSNRDDHAGGLTSLGDYLYESVDNEILRYAKADGSLVAVAGSSTAADVDATGTDAAFHAVGGLATDGTSLFAADTGNNLLRQISSTDSLPSELPSSSTTTLSMDAGAVWNVAGSGDDSTAAGTGDGASLASPQGVVDVGGDAYVGTADAVMKVNLTTRAASVLSGSAGDSECVDATSGASSRHAVVDAMTTDGYYLYTLENCSTGIFAIRRTSIATGATSTVAAAPWLNGGSLTYAGNGLLYYTTENTLVSVDPSSGQSATVATFPNGNAGAQAAAWGVTADADDVYVGVYTYNYWGNYTNATLEQVGFDGTITDVATTTSPSGGFGAHVLASAGAYVYDAGMDGNIQRYDKSTGAMEVIAGDGGNGEAVGVPGGFAATTGLVSDGPALLLTDDNRLRTVVKVPAATADGGPTNSDETLADGNESENLTTCSCVDPVNTATGTLWEQASDLAIPGPGPALSITRAYDSSAASASGLFGYGWAWTYGMAVVDDPVDGSGALSSSPVVDVVQANGSTVAFTRNDDGSYTPPARVLATLTQHEDGTWTFVQRGQLTDTFTSAGLLSTITDLNGQTTSLTYSSGVLATVADPSGRTLSFDYGENGDISSVTDPAGRTVSYGYDSGNLTSVTDPAGRETDYGYDSRHLLTSVTDPRGHATSTDYDSNGWVTSQTDRRGHTTTFDYSAPDSTGSWTVTVTGPNGDVTKQVYSDAELTSQTNGDGTSSAATTTYDYGTTLGVTSTTDPRGYTSTATFDSDGNQTSQTDQLTHDQSWTYNSFDEPLTHTDRNGVETTNSYDSDGNLTGTSTPLAGTDQHQVTSYAYGDDVNPGEVTAMTDPDGKVTHYSYDSDGQRSSVTDPSGDETTYSYSCSSCDPAYDNIGWVYSTVSPRGNATGATAADHRTTYTYNADGDQLSATDPLGHETDDSYDADGNLASVTDARSHTTSYSHNANNQLTTTTLPDSTTTVAHHDANGNITSQTDGNGHTTTDSYNALNELDSTTTPATATHSGGIVTGYTYDADGNPASETRTGTGGSTLTTSYGYDHADRLTSTDYSDGTTPNVTDSYDDNGNRTAMTDGTGSTSYTYDSLGRLTHTTDGASDEVSYGYDLAGNVTAITYPNGHTVARGYDDSSRLTSVTDWNDDQTTFSYDPDSDLTAIDYPNGVTESTSYDNADVPSELSDTTTGSTLADYGYTRNDNNQLTAAAATGADAGPSESYDENSRNQIDSYDNGTTTGDYSYDNAGNLTALPDGTTQSYDDAGELTSSTDPAAVTTDYTYDQQGNRTVANPSSGTTQDYSYDQASYTYNGDGLRANKTVDATTTPYTWDTVSGANPLLLTDGTTNYLYGPNDLPIEQTNTASTTIHYLQHDQQNSTRLLTDPDGTVTGTYNYTPNGTTAAHTGTSTPLRYDGQYQDNETGFYYLHARYYDPTTAQFLTRDPLEAETGQPYSYAGDDPIDNSDPSGLLCVLGHNSDGSCRGSSEYNWSVENLDPVSYALPYYAKEYDSYSSGCSFAESFKYGAEGAVILGLSGFDPEDDAVPFAEHNLEHIFRDSAGHFAEDTTENRALVQSAVKPGNYVRTGGGGEQLFRETLPDGTQVWAKVYDGKVTNGGLNQTPLH